MSLSFEHQTLFESAPDDNALLVKHNSKLVALLIRLSSAHHEHEGSWAIEWASDDKFASREIFQSLEAFTSWLDQKLNPNPN